MIEDSKRIEDARMLLKKINMKKIIVGLLIIVALVVLVFIQKRDGAGQTELKEQVYAVVEAKTEGNWDKNIEIVETDQSGNVVIGTWSAGDVWQWIAWREDAGAWNILISLDGFDCEELALVPDAHDAFFSEVTHAPSGELYCYTHISR